MDEQKFWISKIAVEYTEKEEQLKTQYERDRAELNAEWIEFDKGEFKRTGNVNSDNSHYPQRMAGLEEEFERNLEKLHEEAEWWKSNWEIYRIKPPSLDITPRKNKPTPKAVVEEPLRQEAASVGSVEPRRAARAVSPLELDGLPWATSYEQANRGKQGSSLWKIAVAAAVCIPIIVLALLLAIPWSTFYALDDYDSVPKYNIYDYDEGALTSEEIDEIFMNEYGHPYYRTDQKENEMLSVSAVQAELDTINEVLDFGDVYREGYFDCSEMATFLEYYFENQCGWDTYIIVGDSNMGPHAWVYMEDEYGNYVHVESTDLFVIDSYNWEMYEYTMEATYGNVSSLCASHNYVSDEWDWWNTRYAPTLGPLGYD